MAYQALRRVPARRSGGIRQPKHKPFLAPVRGWYTATNLAAAPDGSALILENWYPTATGIKMRRGSAKHGRAATDKPLESGMAYNGASSSKIFGAADGDILDLTSPADADIAPTPEVTGQTSNYYAHINFTNPAGTNYLMCANGTDEIQTYDGSAWAALVSGTDPGQLDGLDSATVDHLNVYKNRIWLTNKTMTAYYLPTDSIAGAAGDVPLAGVFRNGGYILFSATWSVDAGNGPNEFIVFASSKGEYAIYQGDPASASSWGLVGLYDASPALGKNAFIRVGGDLLVLTEIGLIPMSLIKNKDPAALALASISRNVQPDWQAEVQSRRALPWEVVKWTSRNIAYITCPVTSDASVTPPICFAVNLETGAWSKVTGWNTRCFILHEDGVYFGTNAGTLMRADVGGYDDGALIYYTYAGHMDHLGAVGAYKTVTQVRAIFLTLGAFNPLLSVATDYSVSLPAFPAATIPGAASLWDVGLWDQAKWDGGVTAFTVITGWVSIGRSGFAHAPVILVTSGSALAPSAELVAFDALYNPGGLVV